MSVSAIQQSEIYMYAYVSPPSWASHPPLRAKSSQSRAELPVLQSSFLLAIYFTCGGGYVPVHPTPHPVSTRVPYICVSIPAL